MGSASTKISKSEEKLVDLKQYIREADIEKDERYGENVRVYRQVSSTQRAAIITKLFDNSISFQATLDIQKMTGQLKHPGLVQQLSMVEKRKENICSKFFKIKCLYEYINNDIQNDIQQRIKCKEFLKEVPEQELLEREIEVDSELRPLYDESELWHILATATAVLSYLGQIGVSHGDIRPYNLCLNTEGSLKLMGVNSLIQTNWSSYCEKLEGHETKNTYISPIQLSALKHKIQKPQHNISKSDIFCLGVIILECCMLESVQDIYDFQNYSVDVSKRLKKLKESNAYSETFIRVLSEVLTIDEENRPTPESLYEQITQLASEKEISISGKITSLEKTMNFLHLFYQKNKKVILKPTDPKVGDASKYQQQQFLVSNYEQMQKIEVNHLSTEDELPNQEDGEIINELGILDNIEKEDRSDSFSIKKSSDTINGNTPRKSNSDRDRAGSFRSKGGNSISQIKKDMTSTDFFRQYQETSQNWLLLNSGQNTNNNTANNTNNNFYNNKENKSQLFHKTGGEQSGLFKNHSQHNATSGSNLFEAAILKMKSQSQHPYLANSQNQNNIFPFGNNSANKQTVQLNNNSLIDNTQQQPQQMSQFQQQQQMQIVKAAAAAFLANSHNHSMNGNNNSNLNQLQQNPLLLQIAKAAMLQQKQQQLNPLIMQAGQQNDINLLQMLIANQVQQQQQQNQLNAVITIALAQQQQQKLLQQQQMGQQLADLSQFGLLNNQSVNSFAQNEILQNNQSALNSFDQTKFSNQSLNAGQNNNFTSFGRNAPVNRQQSAFFGGSANSSSSKNNPQLSNGGIFGGVQRTGDNVQGQAGSISSRGRANIF